MLISKLLIMTLLYLPKPHVSSNPICPLSFPIHFHISFNFYETCLPFILFISIVIALVIYLEISLEIMSFGIDGYQFWLHCSSILS